MDLNHSPTVVESTLPSDLNTQRFDWMPDWRGDTVVIVASGPSARDVKLEEGAGLARYIVINDSWKLAPWADVLYACDYAWWLKNRGKPDWPGMKVSQDRIACEMFPDIKRIYAERKGNQHVILDVPGAVIWGGNSGMQALNLSVNLGARKILLVGFDMCISRGVHWHAKHGPGLSNPREMTVARWRSRMDYAAPVIAKRGVHVINCALQSALQNYPKMTFEEALNV